MIQIGAKKMSYSNIYYLENLTWEVTHNVLEKE